MSRKPDWKPGTYQVLKNTNAKAEATTSSAKTRNVRAGTYIKICRIQKCDNRIRGKTRPEGDWITLENLEKKKKFVHIEVRTKAGTRLDCRRPATMNYYEFCQLFKKARHIFDKMQSILERNAEHLSHDKSPRHLQEKPSHRKSNKRKRNVPAQEVKKKKRKKISPLADDNRHSRRNPQESSSEAESKLKEAGIRGKPLKILLELSKNDSEYFTVRNIERLFGIKGIGEKTIEKVSNAFMSNGEMFDF